MSASFSFAVSLSPCASFSFCYLRATAAKNGLQEDESGLNMYLFSYTILFSYSRIVLFVILHPGLFDLLVCHITSKSSRSSSDCSGVRTSGSSSNNCSNTRNGGNKKKPKLALAVMQLQQTLLQRTHLQ